MHFSIADEKLKPFSSSAPESLFACLIACEEKRRRAWDASKAMNESQCLIACFHASIC
jgi:hypothetical protein